MATDTTETKDQRRVRQQREKVRATGLEMSHCHAEIAAAKAGDDWGAVQDARREYVRAVGRHEEAKAELVFREEDLAIRTAKWGEQ